MQAEKRLTAATGQNTPWDISMIGAERIVTSTLLVVRLCEESGHSQHLQRTTPGDLAECHHTDGLEKGTCRYKAAAQRHRAPGAGRPGIAATKIHSDRGSSGYAHIGGNGDYMAAGIPIHRCRLHGLLRPHSDRNALGLTARGAFGICTVNICKERFIFRQVTGKLQTSYFQVDYKFLQVVWSEYLQKNLRFSEVLEAVSRWKTLENFILKNLRKPEIQSWGKFEKT